MAIDVIEVQKALKGADYPADGEELAAQARENGAEDDLVEALEDLPELESPTAVMEQLKRELGDDLSGGED